MLLGFLSLMMAVTAVANPPKSVADAPQKKKSYEQIQTLKNGALLVSLKSKAKSIEALKKTGNYEEAKRLDSFQRKKNKEIIDAFRKHYDFSQVLFFYNDQIEDVANKRFEKVTFLNNNLQPDSSIRLNTQDYLLATYGITSRGEFTVTHKRTGETRTFTDASNISLNAIVIKDPELNELDRPFPVKMKTYDGFDVEPERAIRRMNKRFAWFYRRSVKG